MTEKAKRGPGNFKQRVAEEAEKQGLSTEGLSMAQQEALIPPGEIELKPMAIVDGKIVADYVRPHYGVEESEQYIDLEFSFPLTPAHRGYLPKSVEKCWEFLNRHICGNIGNIEVSDQTMDIYEASDDKPLVHISVKPITKAQLAWVEQTGKGASEKVVRFLFRIRVEVNKNNCHFADTFFGKSVYVVMDDAQGEIE